MNILVIISLSFLMVVSILCGSSAKPNFVFIMADDMGVNDFSWNNEHMLTPTLEELATGSSGVILNNAYVNMLCSPTRSAFLTGYYPHRMGLQGGTFSALEPMGVPTQFTFLPKQLAQSGYKNYMVGKWHLGYCASEYTPLQRGFDKFYGFYFYNGGGDYYDHNVRTGTGEVPNYENKKYLDFTDNLTPDFSRTGEYSTEVFAEKAEEYLDAHASDNPNDPFFMYFSLQAAHKPAEVPESYKADCGIFAADPTRETYCGMVKAMDVAVARVVQKLKDHGIYDNTVIIFSNDNGGYYGDGSNNYPLRGNKGSLWEGGTKAISFISSPTLVQSNGTRDELFHITDWFPTIVSMAGGDISSFAGDGIDQTDMLLTDTTSNPRDKLVYNINTKGLASFTAGGSAMRIGDYKIIVGEPSSGYNFWNPPDFCEPNCVDTNIGDKEKGVWIFDLATDPNETTDLSATVESSFLKSLRQEVLAEQTREVDSIHLQTFDLAGHPQNWGDAYQTGWCTAV